MISFNFDIAGQLLSSIYVTCKVVVQTTHILREMAVRIMRNIVQCMLTIVQNLYNRRIHEVRKSVEKSADHRE